MTCLSIHDELDRLILRKRWLRWVLRDIRRGQCRSIDPHYVRLSDRLTRWRPTWEQRRRLTKLNEG